jgi:NAD(P)H dehydrogenase (quinone)
MNILILFHSVSGNCYEIAKYFETKLENHTVRVRRVEDSDLETYAKKYDIVEEYKNKILNIDVVEISDSRWADLIIIGSPTYFGNVSAEIKVWMDAHSVFYQTEDLRGKRIIAYTSCGSLTGSPLLCLQAIHNFAYHLGMNPVTIPVSIKGNSVTPFGIVHCAGDYGLIRPSLELEDSILEIVHHLL